MKVIEFPFVTVRSKRINSRVAKILIPRPQFKLIKSQILEGET